MSTFYWWLGTYRLEAPVAVQFVGLAAAVVDLHGQVAYHVDAPRRLTDNEGTILRALVQADGEPVSHAELLSSLGYRAPAQTNAVAMTIRRLRQKIERLPSKPTALRTIPRLGYRLAHQRLSDAVVGRSQELTATASAMWEHRCVTLVGPAGVGKSRIATELLRLLDGPYEGRVHLAELRRCRSIAAVDAAVGQSLGLSTGERGWGAAVQAHLEHAGPTLLVLDNAERIAWDLAAVVQRWLDAAPRLRLLVTSREALHAHGEHRVRVHPMDAESAHALVARLGCLGSRDAVVERADGLPFALERLVRAPELPAGGPLDPVLDSSWETLSDLHQGLLARCSLFRAPFEADAAAALSGRSVRGVGRVLLTELADRSLVERVGQRWRMLAPIAEYADARLSPEQRDDARRRHAAWFADRAEEHAERSRTWERPAVLAALHADRRDIGWVLSAADDHPAAALRSAVALSRARADRGHLPGFIALIGRLLGHPEVLPELRTRGLLARARAHNHGHDHSAALADLDAIAAGTPPIDVAHRVMLERAWALDQLGHQLRATALLEAALMEARARRDRLAACEITKALAARRPVLVQRAGARGTGLCATARRPPRPPAGPGPTSRRPGARPPGRGPPPSRRS
ncbi:MAG: DNA-binding winged helix-turn-helix (wHTH) protein [Myxococcota bacterium]